MAEIVFNSFSVTVRAKETQPQSVAICFPHMCGNKFTCQEKAFLSRYGKQRLENC